MQNNTHIRIIRQGKSGLEACRIPYRTSIPYWCDKRNLSICRSWCGLQPAICCNQAFPGVSIVRTIGLRFGKSVRVTGDRLLQVMEMAWSFRIALHKKFVLNPFTLAVMPATDDVVIPKCARR